MNYQRLGDYIREGGCLQPRLESEFITRYLQCTHWWKQRNKKILN